ncbi:MAG: lecithin retinol acyltransferase family protein [Fretibacterium sp.]|nr:lecithin retinol acyltransferase family protein [Fretibacterium sp.]
MKGSKLKDYHLYSGLETVARARSQLGKEGYSIAGNNCEHFAVWCKTGLKESTQVNNAIEILLALCG